VLYLLLLRLSVLGCLVWKLLLLLLELLAVSPQQEGVAVQCRKRWSGRVAAVAALQQTGAWHSAAQSRRWREHLCWQDPAAWQRCRAAQVVWVVHSLP
jgi:hypothetical protein